jgi:hypothetical protein
MVVDFTCRIGYGHVAFSIAGDNGMAIDNGSMLHVTENLAETVDDVELTLPAGDYRALAVAPVEGEASGDAAERYLLLPVGRERMHPISAEGLEQLAEHDRVEVIGTE